MRGRYWSGLVTLLCAMSRSAAASGPTALEPEPSAGEISALLKPFDTSNGPGMVVAVFRAGRLALVKAVGMGDLEHGLRLTPDSVFDIASMSKQFTAMAIVLLSQQGVLSLDDDVRKYVPELPRYRVPITIRHLLQHTSGIHDYIDVLELSGRRPEVSIVTQDDVLDVLKRLRTLNFAPGSSYRYENSGYALMPIVIQRASGESLARFAADRIFKPLGMNSTFFCDDRTRIIRNRAMGYDGSPGNLHARTPLYEEIGDGGVWTTVGDLMKWDANFYTARVGGEDGLKLLQTQASVQSRRMSYAMGLFIGEYQGHKLVSHGGVDPGYRVQMLRFPDDRVTVAVLANDSDLEVETVARQIARLVLKEGAEAAPIPASSEAALPSADLAGRYLDEKSGVVRELRVLNRQMELLGRPPTVLQALSTDRFRNPSTGTLYTFDRPSRGAIRLTVAPQGEEPSVSRALPPSYSPTSILPFRGTFINVDLKVRWRLEVSKKALTLRRPGAAEESLVPLDLNRFSASIGYIRFERAGSGYVTGFALSNVRDSGIEFHRVPQPPHRR